MRHSVIDVEFAKCVVFGPMITPVQSLYLASLEKNEQKVEKHEESTKPVSSRTAPSGAIFMVDYTRKHTV